ncbi:MAG TPA: hypothetical protein VFH47_05740, partial [Candidatus Thermoplasmatota archaeon]|nr:hypothetical protein [Candidatus Thermoplasmatota archaeon]
QLDTDADGIGDACDASPLGQPPAFQRARTRGADPAATAAPQATQASLPWREAAVAGASTLAGAGLLLLLLAALKPRDPPRERRA